MSCEQSMKRLGNGYREFPGNHATFPEIIGVSDSISRVRKTVERIGPTDLNVIIYGENGTGKDLVAEALHWNSGRSAKPFVKINPLMIPYDSCCNGELEDDVDADKCEAGDNLRQVFNSACGGTLFIDRIQEIPPGGQVTLLRFFRNFEGQSGGGNNEAYESPRFLVSSTRDLTGLIMEGTFRADLFHRLNEISIHLPPLKDRKEDIMPLCDHFLRLYARRYKKKIPAVDGQTFELFYQYQWPGNVRELSNIIHRLVVLGNEEQIQQELRESITQSLKTTFHDEEAVSGDTGALPRDLEETWPGKQRGVHEEATVCEGLKDISQRVVEKVEMEAIMRVLEYTRWHRKKAARLLGVNYRTLLNKIRKYGLGENLEA